MGGKFVDYDECVDRPIAEALAKLKFVRVHMRRHAINERLAARTLGEVRALLAGAEEYLKVLGNV